MRNPVFLVLGLSVVVLMAGQSASQTRRVESRAKVQLAAVEAAGAAIVRRPAPVVTKEQSAAQGPGTRAKASRMIKMPWQTGVFQ